MDAATPLLTPTEASWRYRGWRVVLVCFMTAAFAWALGFYGQSVFLAELQRLHGWSPSVITAATTFFYLASAALVVFTGDAIRRLGPALCLPLAVGFLAGSTLLFSVVATPWQLFAAYGLMAIGWAGLSTAAIGTTLALWFDHRRGLAISLALNGASIGGVIGVPLLVGAIAAVGFARTMQGAAVLLVAVLVPLIVIGLRAAAPVAPSSHPPATASSSKAARRAALRSLRFWTITGPFALVLLAQVGFIVHQIAYMEPLIGRGRASLAVALMTVMAVVGRVGLGVVIDRIDQRAASAALFAGQALSVLAMLLWPIEPVLLAGSAVFGLAVGNAITLPSVIVHHEFDRADFGTVVSLMMAMTSVVSACGPLLTGALHDLAGGYALPFGIAAALEAVAALGILVRDRAPAA
jgi:MFS family permease